MSSLEALAVPLLGRTLGFLPPSDQAVWVRADDDTAFLVGRWLLLDVFAAIRNKNFGPQSVGRFLAYAPPGRIYGYEDHTTGLPHGASDRLIRILDASHTRRLETAQKGQCPLPTPLFSDDEWEDLFERTFGDEWTLTLWPARYGPAGKWVASLLAKHRSLRVAQLGDPPRLETHEPGWFWKVFRAHTGSDVVMRSNMSVEELCITAKEALWASCSATASADVYQHSLINSPLADCTVAVLGQAHPGMDNVELSEYVCTGVGDRIALYFNGYAAHAIPTGTVRQLHVAGSIAISAICFNAAWPALEAVDMTSCWFVQLVAAFANCPELRTLLLPPRVATIDQIAFRNCASLIDLDLRSSHFLTHIFGFQECQGLKRVWLPSNVQVIGRGAFAGCIALQEIRFAPAASTDDALTIEGAFSWCRVGSFSDCVAMEVVDLTACTKLTQMRGFEGGLALTSVLWPAGVGKLPLADGAFKGCPRLGLH